MATANKILKGDLKWLIHSSFQSGPDVELSFDVADRINATHPDPCRDAIRYADQTLYDKVFK